METYVRRKWLNPKGPQTSSVTAFHGESYWGRTLRPTTFLNIKDCNHSVKLHVYSDDKHHRKFIKKLCRLAREITRFADWLERQQ